MVLDHVNHACHACLGTEGGGETTDHPGLGSDDGGDDVEKEGDLEEDEGERGLGEIVDGGDGVAVLAHSLDFFLVMG